ARAHYLPKRRERVPHRLGAVERKEPNPTHVLRLLRRGSERQCEKRARRCADKSAPVHHWITSSARSSSDCGIVKPSALAVLRLMTNSNLVGCSMGRSPGFVPLKILSTRAAVRLIIAGTLGP